MSVPMLGACTPTAAQRLADNPTLAASAQMDEYRRDAEATITAREAEVARVQLELQRAAGAATQASANATATVNKQATIEATETAAYWAMVTKQAVINATGTARYEAGLTQTAETHQTNTQVAAESATGTAIVVATQTKITYDRQQTEIALNTAVTYGLGITFIVAVCVIVYLGYRFGTTANANQRKRGSVIPTGLNGQNSLVVLDSQGGQTVINPDALPTAGVTINAKGGFTPLGQFSAEDQLKNLMWDHFKRWVQGQHSPHPPAVPTETVTRQRLGMAEWERIVRQGHLLTGRPSMSTRHTTTQSPVELLPSELQTLATLNAPEPTTDYDQRFVVVTQPPLALPMPTVATLNTDWKEIDP